MITLTLGLNTARPVAQVAGQIGVVGEFLGDGPWARWSGRWLALMERDGGFELSQVVVTSTPQRAICGDIGFAVHAPVVPRGTLLLRGFPAVKAGRVTAGFHGRKFLLPAESLTLPLGNDASWALHAFGTVRPAVAGGLGEAQITNYEVHLTGTGRSGVVFSVPRVGNDGPPTILWAGDLDGDRVVDLYVELRGYPGRQYALFLSSAAGSGQLVAQAASLTTNGC